MNSKKKIDLIIDSLGLGGAERVCCNYANILTDEGYSVRILYFRHSEASYLHTLNKEVDVKLVKSKNGIDFILRLFFNDIKLSRDVIVFNHQLSVLVKLYSLIAFKKLKILARNVNFLSHDLDNKPSSVKKYLTILATKTIYRHMNGYIAQCESMKLDMVDNYHIPSEKIKVIYNPISEKIFSVDRDKNIDILFVGRMSNQKGIDFLAEILERCLVSNPELRICLVGKGDDEHLLSYLLNNYQDNITRVLETSNINDYYNSAKLTILTSRYEGFPNVLAESLSVGTPVISFDCKSGPSEIIDDGINGYLIDNFDIDDFVSKILFSLNSGIFNRVNYTKGNTVNCHLISLIEKSNAC